VLSKNYPSNPEMKETLEKREAAVRNHVSRLVGGWLWGLHGNVNENIIKDNS
jgi:hypothetical protein